MRKKIKRLAKPFVPAFAVPLAKTLLTHFTRESRRMKAELRSLQAALDTHWIRISGRKIRVRFFAQVPETWTSIESAWKAFSEDPRCDTVIILMPFGHAAYERAPLRDFLLARGLPFIDCSQYDLGADRPDVVFYQSPYDSALPGEFRIERVSESTRRIAYIPYGLEIGGGAENTHYMFGMPIHDKAWRIFARSESHKGMYGRHCRKGNSHVAVVGHPKFDAVAGFTAREADPELIKRVAGRKAFLWNPHFSTNAGLNFSTFMRWKDLLLDAFTKRKDAVLIFRPHPLLFKDMMNRGVLSQADVNTLRALATSSDTIFLDERPSYLDSFLVSSALMSDTSSFLLEYLPTGKPILHLRNEESAGLNEDAPLLDTYYSGQTEGEILGFIEMVMKGQDPGKERRMSAMPHYLYKPDGGAGERIKEHVIDAVLAGL